MANVLLLLVAAAVAGGLVFGVAALITGQEPGLDPAEPDGRAVPLPATRPLAETDLTELRFDVAFRGYRMAQVDTALRRASYDIGFKEELIKVLDAEVDALRAGRLDEAETLRQVRDAAFSRVTPAGHTTTPEPVPPAEPSATDAAPAQRDAAQDAAPTAQDAAPAQQEAGTAPDAVGRPVDAPDNTEPETAGPETAGPETAGSQAAGPELVGPPAPASETAAPDGAEPRPGRPRPFGRDEVAAESR